MAKTEYSKGPILIDKDWLLRLVGPKGRTITLTECTCIVKEIEPKDGYRQYKPDTGSQWFIRIDQTDEKE